MTTETKVKTKTTIPQKSNPKGLSLVSIAKELNCLHPSCQSARKDLLLQEMNNRHVTDYNFLEWLKAFKVGGVKNKFSELRCFQIIIIKKLFRLESSIILKKNIPLFELYIKELKVK
ncbi:MAG: hypothetical protein PHH12_02770 [Candidatus Shapirobacteria bacterium]|jgi:hypothetical protein|nr:hypothetical protein [Candidatus Shapirobacteria bacterium]